VNILGLRVNKIAAKTGHSNGIVNVTALNYSKSTIYEIVTG